ncbi:hypothetical protein CVU37_09175 [candidate division BRC1 bacterium HGW-BRC1-1]|nr:MAG: hypothetical protein CVU37_09175 [candidate division BRC1 bacterium HGW-BRC1-1]
MAHQTISNRTRLGLQPRTPGRFHRPPGKRKNPPRQLHSLRSRQNHRRPQTTPRSRKLTMRTLLPDDTKIKNSYSLPEVARALGVSVRTIQRIVSRREIRSVRISRTTRITRECLLEYLDQNERTEEY